MTVDPTPLPDGSFAFQATIPALPLGKHLLYFFQAPPPPANATQAEIDAHYRAFASIAATPKSRIAVALPPPPLGLPVGAGVLTSVAGLVLGASSCALSPGAACALPGADVNIHDGPRVWTTRASDTGDWQIALADITAGWHQLTFGQVVDSPAGGGWVESCPSPVLPVGVGTTGAGAPALQLPGGLSVDAASAAGALLDYAAGATTAAGAPLPVDCQPRSGAVFPLGVSHVVCTAVDPATQAVAVGTFPVTVVDGPPIIQTERPRRRHRRRGRERAGRARQLPGDGHRRGQRPGAGRVHAVRARAVSAEPGHHRDLPGDRRRAADHDADVRGPRARHDAARAAAARGAAGCRDERRRVRARPTPPP